MNNLSIIVAKANNNVIGINNTLPWHLPEDLKRFRSLTMGHHIIMGRKTYESLGRLLPGRTTIIVTRNKSYQVTGALIAHSLQAAILLAADDAEPFLIGGAQLYEEGLTLANKIYMTQVKADFAGDAFFMPLTKDWQEMSRESRLSENGLAFEYVLYALNKF